MNSFKEFNAGDLFVVRSNPQLDKRCFEFRSAGKYPYFTRTVLNNGIAGYVDYLDEGHLTRGGVLAVGMMGMKFFYFNDDFYSGQFTKNIRPRNFKLNREIALYFKTLLDKNSQIYTSVLVRDFKRVFDETKLSLPITKTGEIDFGYMEARIREYEEAPVRRLDAYFKKSGLVNCVLSEEDRSVLKKYREGRVLTKKFKIGDLFSDIVQGSRLTKNEQKKGLLPFVMSGTTNTGISDHISNDVEVFPKNSITVDIFGNAFYRDYSYGMGDDTGALWNSDNRYNKYQMIYITSVIQKALRGLFDYGHKLRSSQISPYEILLPVDQNKKLDLDFMEQFIKIQQKLAIKDVIEWRDKQIKTTK